VCVYLPFGVVHYLLNKEFVAGMCAQCLGSGGLDARMDAIKADGVKGLEEVKEMLVLEEAGVSFEEGCLLVLQTVWKRGSWMFLRFDLKTLPPHRASPAKCHNVLGKTRGVAAVEILRFWGVGGGGRGFDR
jgi:hypothetical protein